MKASLDTNVIIHLYRAKMQDILFDIFTGGVYIYEQIRNTELENHGKELLPMIDRDIELGKIQLYTNERLKQEAINKIFENNVKENRLLYGTGDLGEVYAISLAQTIGVYSLVTNDTKQGGPYMSLMQLNIDVVPFNFADVLILRCLLGKASAEQTLKDFNCINNTSNLKWIFKNQLIKFIKRFLKDPYKRSEKEWFNKWTKEYHIQAIDVFKELRRYVE